MSPHFFLFHGLVDGCSPKDRGLKKINLENRVSIFRFKIDILLHILYAKTSTKISIFWYQNIDIWGTSFQGQNQYSENMFVRCKPCRRVKDLDTYIYICMSYIYLNIYFENIDVFWICSKSLPCRRVLIDLKIFILLQKEFKNQHKV